MRLKKPPEPVRREMVASFVVLRISTSVSKNCRAGEKGLTKLYMLDGHKPYLYKHLSLVSLDILKRSVSSGLPPREHFNLPRSSQSEEELAGPTLVRGVPNAGDVHTKPHYEPDACPL